MSESLLEAIDFERFEQQGADFIGHYDLGQMPRLVAEAIDVSGQCDVELSIDRENGGYRAKGRVRAEFDLPCQRCLEPVRHVADVVVEADIVSEERDEHRHSDVWVLDEKHRLQLRACIEDELLLTIDDVPKHADENDCNQDMIFRATEYEPDEAEVEASNPFAVLKDLKQ